MFPRRRMASYVSRMMDVDYLLRRRWPILRMNWIREGYENYLIGIRDGMDGMGTNRERIYGRGIIRKRGCQVKFHRPHGLHRPQGVEEILPKAALPWDMERRWNEATSMVRGGIVRLWILDHRRFVLLSGVIDLGHFLPWILLRNLLPQSRTWIPILNGRKNTPSHQSSYSANPHSTTNPPPPRKSNPP